MRIDPTAQLKLYLCAFLGGVLLGGVRELGRLLCVLLGAHRPPDFMRAAYARPLPLLKRPAALPAERLRRVWRAVLQGAMEIGFCLLAAGILELLLFYFNSGVFRLQVPVLLLLGLALWVALLSRPLSHGIAWLGYLLTALLTYLYALVLLPWRGFLRFAARPLAALAARLRLYFAARRSAALCAAQLAAAKNGRLRLFNNKGSEKRKWQEKRKRAAPRPSP